MHDVLDAELDGAPAPRCVLGPATERLGGDWLGAPVAGLDDLAATLFAATVEVVPVTHPQPFRADVVLARGRVPASLVWRAVSDGSCASEPKRGPRALETAVRFRNAVSNWHALSAEPQERLQRGGVA